MGIDILVIGDANPDLVLTGDTVPRFGQAEQLLDAADLLLGGSAGIVAGGLARLGVATALCARVGDDAFGQFMIERLAERGVVTSVIDRDQATATGISVILSTPDDRAILTLLGTIPTLTADHVRAAVATLRPRHVHAASYFLQPGMREGLPQVCAELRDAGVTISLDTNWDPAERWEGLAELLPLVDVLMPNLEEALALASVLEERDVSELDEAGCALSARGPRVVVKAGKDGGVAFEAGARVAAAPGLVLDVVDTTGAGDSFDAGYLAALLGGVEDEPVRVRWAAVAGSLSVRGRGGTASQATRPEVQAALG